MVFQVSAQLTAFVNINDAPIQAASYIGIRDELGTVIKYYSCSALLRIVTKNSSLVYLLYLELILYYGANQRRLFRDNSK